MLNAIITIGIPASGKSTFAKKFCKENDYHQIERDGIRARLFGNIYSQENNPGVIDWKKYKFTAKNEKAVTEEVYNRIVNAKANNMNIIVSDTNLNTKHRHTLKKFLETEGYNVEYYVFPVEFEEAIKRDNARSTTVGYSTIARMHDNFLDFLESEDAHIAKFIYSHSERPMSRYKAGGTKVKVDNKLTECYVFDIDGTLAEMVNRKPFDWERVGEDSCYTHVAKVLTALRFIGYDIVILSGRDEVCRTETEQWLKENNIEYDALFMRPTGSFEKDTIVKREMLKQDVLPNWNPLGVFDDRPSVCRMWREAGIPVFQLGNPYIEF